MFNCAVSHCGHIYNVSGPHPGSRNDKTAVKYDNFVMSIKEKELFQDVEWSYYDANGIWNKEKGCWLLADGGYHRWRCVPCCLMCAPLLRSLVALFFFLHHLTDCPLLPQYPSMPGEVDGRRV